MNTAKPETAHSKGKSILGAARGIAFEILLRVETQSSYASELLSGPMTSQLDERDAGLCTELVMGTLRWQATLDFLARRYVKKWDSFDPEVRIALRLGLYQLRYLCGETGRMPERAAIFETVELVKAARKRSAAGLVNAVLRKAAAEGVGGDLARMRPAGQSDLDWLAIETSTPAWMLDRWILRFGRDEAVALAQANNRTPETSVRLNPSPGRSETDVECELVSEGVRLRPGLFLKQCRVVESGSLSRTEAFRRGEVVVQDEASQMVPLLLGVKPSERVLDLCAAPGNKTAQLAALAGADGLVVACDVHFHRLRQFAPAPESGRVARVALDGTKPLPFGDRFDRILIDAPCSGTGTLRRNPEIKWRLTQNDIQILSERQLQLLNNAAEVLGPGGQMVYSICSLEAEEGEDVVKKFLECHPDIRPIPLREKLKRLEREFHSNSVSILGSNSLATIPSVHHVDGFFACILRHDANNG